MAGQIEHIATFLAVAQQGGFSVAGRALGLSPSIVTRHIADLEDHLGVQLFIRSTRKVALTGPLAVSAPLSFGMRVLPDIMGQFRILHPNVEINLQLTDRMVDIADEGYDMALRISGPPRDQTTIWSKISQIKRVIAASPNYLAKHGTPRTPQDLSAHACLHYAERLGPVVWPLNKGGQTHQIAIKPWLTCNNGDTLNALAEQGEGIVIMPLFIAQQGLEDGRLTQVLSDWSTPPIWLTATYPNYERLPTKVAAFSNFVQAAMAP